MLSGRNGVRFPIGPPALGWAMGLEVAPGVCIYIWVCQKRMCVWDWVVFTEMWVEGAEPTLSHEQRADCAAERVGRMARIGSGEKVWQNAFPLKPRCDRWQRDCCHITSFPTFRPKPLARESCINKRICDIFVFSLSNCSLQLLILVTTLYKSIKMGRNAQCIVVPWSELPSFIDYAQNHISPTVPFRPEV